MLKQMHVNVIMWQNISNSFAQSCITWTVHITLPPPSQWDVLNRLIGNTTYSPNLCHNVHQGSSHLVSQPQPTTYIRTATYVMQIANLGNTFSQRVKPLLLLCHFLHTFVLWIMYQCLSYLRYMYGVHKCHALVEILNYASRTMCIAVLPHHAMPGLSSCLFLVTTTCYVSLSVVMVAHTIAIHFVWTIKAIAVIRCIYLHMCMYMSVLKTTGSWLPSTGPAYFSGELSCSYPHNYSLDSLYICMLRWNRWRT